MSRPNLLWWLWYALGGRLPERMRDWVRHDLTDADWRLRVLLRLGVQILIPCVLIIVVPPGPRSVRILTAVLVVCGALLIGGTYGDVIRDRRLRQHGFGDPD